MSLVDNEFRSGEVVVNTTKIYAATGDSLAVVCFEAKNECVLQYISTHCVGDWMADEVSIGDAYDETRYAANENIPKTAVSSPILIVADIILTPGDKIIAYMNTLAEEGGLMEIKVVTLNL
jgi:hypothetical protein